MLGFVFCPGFAMWFFVFFNPFKINGISHIKFDTVKSGWSIVYIEGSQVKNSPFFLSLKIIFVFTNSADSDEMPHHYATFHLGLHCLPKYPFWGFWSEFSKG